MEKKRNTMAGILYLRLKILISLKFIRKSNFQDCFLLEGLLQGEEEIIIENSKHNSVEQNLED